MATAVYISASDLEKLSAPTRNEIVTLLLGASSIHDEPAPEPLAIDDEADGPIDLSVAQARNVINGCSERPKRALRFVAEQPGPEVLMSVLEEHVGRDNTGGLRGVYGAITRRTRNVMGDPNADFFWWDDEGLPEGEKRGVVSQMTHSSLRKAFGIK